MPFFSSDPRESWYRWKAVSQEYMLHTLNSFPTRIKNLLRASKAPGYDVSMGKTLRKVVQK